MNLEYNNNELKEVTVVIGRIDIVSNEFTDNRCMILIEYKNYQNISILQFKHVLIFYNYDNDGIEIENVRILDPITNIEFNLDIPEKSAKEFTEKLKKFILKYHIDYELDAGNNFSKKVKNVSKIANRLSEINLKIGDNRYELKL